MLHYFAKDFFSKILVSPWLTDTGNVAVKIISDKRTGPPLKFTLKTTVYSWQLKTAVATSSSELMRLVSK